MNQPSHMRGIAVSLVLISLGLFAVLVNVSLGFQNEPGDFRGIKWGTDVGELKGMSFLAEDGGLRFFERENDSMTVEEVPVDRIVYGFHTQRFFNVLAYYSTLANFLNLKDALTRKHGEPFRPAGTPNRYFWTGDKVEMLLIYEENTMSGRLSYFYKPIQSEAEGKK